MLVTQTHSTAQHSTAQHETCPPQQPGSGHRRLLGPRDMQRLSQERKLLLGLLGVTSQPSNNCVIPQAYCQAAHLITVSRPP